MELFEKYDNVPSIKYQQANSEEHASSLLSNALYDGGVAVHEPSHIECIRNELKTSKIKHL